MAGGNVVRSVFAGHFPEGVELDFAVAQHVRVGRPALGVFVEHVVHHALAVLFGQVHKIEGNANFPGHHFCHKAVFLPLAVPVEGGVCVVPVLHEHGKDVVAFLLEKVRRHRRIYAAGKPDAYFYFALVHIVPQIYAKNQ